ncbi:MAG: 2-oxo acid dehydrogenase subunit E2 [Bacilli bacterium]|nr:2-oxo acid dehydrogenase subunit E2 [Bacilli bacterium]MBO6194923.1 2-oxo acid dehydrogenase subunit E2 [Bacilli bacterium]
MARINSRRIKIGGMNQLMIDLKPRRCDADVFINTPIDVTNLVNYIDKRKKAGEKITYFHAFLLALAKTVYNRPKLNRYVKNRHMYEHTNVSISFVAKVEFEDDSEEVMLIIDVAPDDNIDSISKKIYDQISVLRNKKFEKKGANGVLDTLGALPNVLRVPLVGILKWTDEIGILPKSLQEDDIYFASAIVTDIGSLKSDSIYHNNTNFGSASSITSIGEIRDDIKIVNGKEKIYKSAKFGINFDERVADGFYMIKAFKILEHIIENPKLLEDRADTKVEI